MQIFESLITIIFTMGLLIFYIFIGFIGAMLIQLISYRVFKFNIYKKLIKALEVQTYEK